MIRSTRAFVGVLGLGLAALALPQACSAGGSSDGTGGASSNGSSSGMGLSGAGGVGGISSSTSGLGGGCASTSSEAQQGVLPADIIVVV
ncbi:MAG: hypothetical protein JRI68_25155, partial [Deltaproteobacteria bacterium]|nr:hypothetical protein [Deltaproteobacteria bacterium]